MSNDKKYRPKINPDKLKSDKILNREKRQAHIKYIRTKSRKIGDNSGRGFRETGGILRCLLVFMCGMIVLGVLNGKTSRDYYESLNTTMRFIKTSTNAITNITENVLTTINERQEQREDGIVRYISKIKWNGVIPQRYKMIEVEGYLFDDSDIGYKVSFYETDEQWIYNETIQFAPLMGDNKSFNRLYQESTCVYDESNENYLIIIKHKAQTMEDVAEILKTITINKSEIEDKVTKNWFVDFFFPIV